MSFDLLKIVNVFPMWEIDPIDEQKIVYLIGKKSSGHKRFIIESKVGDNNDEQKKIKTG